MTLKKNAPRFRKHNRALHPYKKLGFEVEGILRNDKVINSRYYNSVVMSRIQSLMYIIGPLTF
jgi:RimJ/RimL family protein N-acetyltransferase